MSEGAPKSRSGAERPFLVISLQKDAWKKWQLKDVADDACSGGRCRRWKPRTPGNQGVVRIVALLALLTKEDPNRVGSPVLPKNAAQAYWFQLARNQRKAMKDTHWAVSDDCLIQPHLLSIEGIQGGHSAAWGRNSRDLPNLKFNIRNASDVELSIDAFLTDFLSGLQDDSTVEADSTCLNEQDLAPTSVVDETNHINTTINESDTHSDEQHFYRYWRYAADKTKLDVPGRRVDDRWLQILSARRECIQIRELGLANTRVTDAGMKYLSAAVNLKSLALDYTDVTNDGISQLAGLSRLQCLFLAGTELDGDEGVKCIQRLVLLRQLSLSNTRIGSKGVSHLGLLTHLEKLWLDYLDESDGAGLACTDLLPILSLKSLQVLAITGSKIGDEGVKLISEHLPSITELYLEDTGVSDDAISSLLRFRDSLQSISMNYNNQITDDGVEQFAGFRRLCRLQLNGTRVSLKGVSQLASLNLAQLSLENTSIRDRDAKQLQTLFPRTEVKI